MSADGDDEFLTSPLCRSPVWIWEQHNISSKTNRSECDVEYDKFRALKSAW